MTTYHSLSSVISRSSLANFVQLLPVLPVLPALHRQRYNELSQKTRSQSVPIAALCLSKITKSLVKIELLTAVDQLLLQIAKLDILVYGTIHLIVVLLVQQRSP